MKSAAAMIVMLSIFLGLMGAAHGQNSLKGVWVVVEMKSPQGTTKLNNAGTNLNFLAQGKWEMIHAGGAVEAGVYQTQGATIHMVYEGGKEVFGDFNVSFSSGRLVLNGTGSSQGYGYTLQRAH